MLESYERKSWPERELSGSRFSASGKAFDVNQLAMKFRTKQQMPVGPLPAPKRSVL